MKRVLLAFLLTILPLSVFADDICPPGYYLSEYVELEYIESTGTQFIDTELKPNGNYRVVCKYKLNRASGGNILNRLFGARNSVNSGNFFTNFTFNGTAMCSFGYNTTYDLFNYAYSADFGIHTIDYGKDIFINDRLITARSLQSFQTNVSMFLFAYNDNGSPAIGTYASIYDFKIYDNGVLLAHFIPVKRLSDNAIGMFDKVEGKFYVNNGTGEFIAGPEITDRNKHFICVLCPENTYKPNAGNEACTPCPTGAFSPIGSTQLSDCAKILRIGTDMIVYMPLGKRTEHGLCTMMDGKKYCADVYERE